MSESGNESEDKTMLEMLKNLKNNDGLTLKNYTPIVYKTGYQVATEGIEVKTIAEALNAINNFNGDCGVWFSDGVWYIDKSHREKTKKRALEVGRAHKQISILCWRTMGLVYC